MTEVRKLSRVEFDDLVKNASDGLKAIEHLKAHGKDAYKFFVEDNYAGGLVVDGVPIYCGCVQKSNRFSFTVIRKDARERYPITLFKSVKRWLRQFDRVNCEIPVGDDRLTRWVERLGFVRMEGIFTMGGCHG